MGTSKTNSSKGSSSAALPLASDLTPFAHGAAGHEGISSDASGSLVIKPCTPAEIAFYESAKDHPEFQAHMPTFLGSLTLSPDPKIQDLAKVLDEGAGASAGTVSASESIPSAAAITGEGNEGSQPTTDKAWVPSGGKQLTTGLAIVLENAAAGFTHPNVLDLKLGARLWDDDAPEAKRQKLDQVASETTSGSLGFRVAGMKVWLEGTSEEKTAGEINTATKDGYRSFNKNYGRNLTAGTVEEAFIRVFGGLASSNQTVDADTNANTNTNNNTEDSVQFQRKRAPLLLSKLLREIESIEHVLTHEESRMYSASVLVVIEGDDAALESGLEYEHEREQQQQKHNATGLDAVEENEDDDEEDGEEEDEEEEDDDDEESEDEEKPKVLEVRLIDFAHARFTPGQGPDQNALIGVRNIQKILRGIVERF